MKQGRPHGETGSPFPIGSAGTAPFSDRILGT